MLSLSSTDTLLPGGTALRLPVPRRLPDHSALHLMGFLPLYQHLYGDPAHGLAPYAGRPLRAVFNDSYELKPDRHYTTDFLATFRQCRGYDATPWLPANMQPVKFSRKHWPCKRSYCTYPFIWEKSC